MRLYKIDRSKGLLDATIEGIEPTEVVSGVDTFATLGQARNALATEMRVERDKWGDAIRRVEAINARSFRWRGNLSEPTCEHGYNAGQVCGICG
jgi:hypothetical protein